jgi:hypothetical protein
MPATRIEKLGIQGSIRLNNLCTPNQNAAQSRAAFFAFGRTNARHITHRHHPRKRMIQ